MPEGKVVSALAARSASTERRLAGLPGVWVLVLFDLCFFLLLFIAFVVEKTQHTALFHAGRLTLDSRLGTLNTLLLLTSSWWVACAVQAAKQGRWAQVRPLIWGAVASGVAFGVVKLSEYAEKIRDGVSPVSDLFFQLYFASTFIHFLHVALGVTAFVILLSRLRKRAPSARLAHWLEALGVYWHMVDLLWIGLFTLYYLGTTT